MEIDPVSTEQRKSAELMFSMKWLISSVGLFESSSMKGFQFYGRGWGSLLSKTCGILVIPGNISHRTSKRPEIGGPYWLI